MEATPPPLTTHSTPEVTPARKPLGKQPLVSLKHAALSDRELATRLRRALDVVLDQIYEERLEPPRPTATSADVTPPP